MRPGVLTVCLPPFLDNGKQLLTCDFKVSKRNGILIIDGKKFKFYQRINVK